MSPTAARAILITGCSSGIGKACALGMRDRGWRVFATARTEADFHMLTDAGLECSYLDYRDLDSIADAMDAVLKATGGALYAVFNNGAYAQPGAVEDLTQAALREQFDANFFGWHEVVRRAVPAMRAQAQGRIIQNSSVLGLIGLRFRGAYTASKFALEGYTDTLRLELLGSGIHVSTIQPGPIRTRIGENALAAAQKHIDWESSVHRADYERRWAQLERQGNSRFQLEPEAVLRVLIHACESRNPRPHYHVTIPTRAAAFARRILPDRAMVRFQQRFGR